ncbi:MAG TPA: tetratricopeptide repeat protein [Rhizomicrobium sp.]|jgi:tetratricopeptide (TPR) repeat protein|nr:tetratricopeptide repeat protein [Rhizomicrobium sp.]
MSIPAASAAVQQVLTAATKALQSGNLMAAEFALAPLFSGRLPANPDLLNIAGTLRMNQGRPAEAAGLFQQAATAAPREPIFAFNLGLTLSRLGRMEEAEAALRAALKCNPDFVQALFELGALLHRTGKLDDAEKHIRKVLRLAPDMAHAALALAAILVDAGRPDEAETAARKGLAAATDRRLKAQLHLQLAQALRRQRKDAEALAALDAAEAGDATLPDLARHRAETLQNLNRFDESVAIYEKEIGRTPTDPGLHLDYNALLYQLGRTGDYLKSYDRVPESRELLLGKAFLLARENRHVEAYDIYEKLKARDPGDRLAAIGSAQLMTAMGNHAEAVAEFEAVLARHGDDAKLLGIAAEPALLSGDPAKAAYLCERGLAEAPHNGSCLAMLSIASRMMEDGRDEALNRYGSLVRIFDLDPPEGFSDMASFNAELNTSLDRMHPKSREFISQSLRGGSQTPGHLFPAGLPLVMKLKRRIDEAVARYIAELDEDESHPLLSRRGRNFRYSGSWSSRLQDCGFHVNHIHPDGWISSCYYVSVPDAVKDETARQGWIKFGEPAIDAALKEPIQRAIQPIAGRLVLFPSYTWHGTVPFHDTAARTTIAFDVVPVS